MTIDLCKKFNCKKPDILKFDETQEYLANMWSRDYGQGLYFSAFHELDQHLFVRMIVDGHSYYAAHALFDGMSCLTELSRNEDLGITAFKESQSRKVSFAGALLGIKEALTSGLKEKIEFKHKRESILDSNQYDFIVLKLKKNKLQNSSTAFLLNTFSKICMNKLSLNKETRWMIPVSVRGAVKKDKKSDLQASYIAVNCQLNDDVATTKEKLVTKLKNNEHWGLWYLSKLGLLLGKSIIMRATRKNLSSKETQWFGSFSNLGNIGGNLNKDMLCLPTVRYHRPIGVAYYIYNEKFYFLINFHRSLNIPLDLIEEIKNEFLQSIS